MFRTLNKKYYCDKCKNKLIEYKPIRMVLQKYGVNNRNQFSNYKHLDFCKTCYNEFVKWFNRKDDNNE